MERRLKLELAAAIQASDLDNCGPIEQFIIRHMYAFVQILRLEFNNNIPAMARHFHLYFTILFMKEAKFPEHSLPNYSSEPLPQFNPKDPYGYYT